MIMNPEYQHIEEEAGLVSVVGGMWCWFSDWALTLLAQQELGLECPTVIGKYGMECIIAYLACMILSTLPNKQ